MSDIGFSLYPIVLPSNYPSTSDLASVHARKGEENWDNLVEQAKEQIKRDSYELPTLNHLKEDSFYKSLSEDQSLYSHLDNTDFILENYLCHPTIKAPLSN